jgi:peptide/nickel transport system substrate-binding protein
MEPSDGARRWVFPLLKDFTFHNGRDLTSEDVLASLRHHLGPDSQSPAKAVLSIIDGYKADGPDTVVITLKEPNVDFPYLLSNFNLPIMPANADGTADWQSGIRTGAYKLESFEPGVALRLTRNDNYHMSPKPYFDSCEMLVLNDVTARTNALTTGEVDWIQRCDLKTLSLLERNPDVEVQEVTGYGHYTFPMLVDTRPFDDLNVRTALKYAIDREQLVKTIFFGHGLVGNDNPIAPAMKYAVNPQPVHSYDPDKARHYLKQAGLDSLKVDLHVSDAAFVGAVDAAALYKESAAKAGIDINIVREPADAYWDNVWRRKSWCACYWWGRATCDWMFSTTYATGGSYNDTHWSNDRFDKLLSQARGELDENKRAEQYAEMQQLVHDDGGTIVMVFNNYVTAGTKKLAHGKLGSNAEADGFRLPERWWFA